MWSYSGDPSSSELDAIRFLVGDTDAEDPLVANEEIAYALSAEGSVQKAAARIARAIAARFARTADKQVGDLRISYSQRAAQYGSIANRLEAQADRSDVRVYAGGIGIADKDAVAQDSDRVRPAFERGRFDIGPSDQGRDDPDWCR